MSLLKINFNELYKLSGHGICGFINNVTGMKYMVYSKNMASWLLNSVNDLGNNRHANKLLNADMANLSFVVFKVPEVNNSFIGKYELFMLMKDEPLLYNKRLNYDLSFDFIVRDGIYLVLKNKKGKKLIVKKFVNIPEAEEYLQSIDYNVYKALCLGLTSKETRWV